jgi:hypothetical protein
MSETKSRGYKNFRILNTHNAVTWNVHKLWKIVPMHKNIHFSFINDNACVCVCVCVCFILITAMALGSVRQSRAVFISSLLSLCFQYRQIDNSEGFRCITHRLWHGT